MSVKISKVSISGMHNVSNVTYTMDDIVYIFGENGAGKSTILQAMQFCMLGYIPGTHKKESAIFEHANCNSMAVSIVFDNDISIERKLTKHGSKIESSFYCSDDSYDVDKLIGNLELPIFNFSEFTSLTANKLKDWFIQFLPSVTSEISWEDRLLSWSTEEEILDNNLISKVLRNVDCSDTPISVARELNSTLKSYQSEYKTKMKTIEESIRTLVHYDDSDLPIDSASIESLQSDIEQKITLKRLELEKHNKNLIDLNILKSTYEAKSFKLESSKNGLLSDEVVDKKKQEEMELTEHLSECEHDIEELKAEYEQHVKRIREYNFDEKSAQIKAEISALEKVINSGGICPFTDTECDSIVEASKTNKVKRTELESNLSKITEEHTNLHKNLETVKNNLELAENSASKTKLELEDLKESICKHNEAVEAINTIDSELLELRSKIDSFDCFDVIKSNIDACNDEISELKVAEDRVEANIRYNNAIDDLIESRDTVENSLTHINNWVKQTGENGIQTTLMTGPFIDMEESMSSYLRGVFNKDISCKFILSNKANSFSFGIVRNGTYIPFNLLSSGEKTLFTFALMLYIVNHSNADAKVLLIDDILDHLDDDKIENFFKLAGNSELSDVQVIMAGVKHCNCESIKIIEINE